MITPLEDVLPVYRHRERHARMIAALPVQVWDALLAVTGRELALSRLLMGIRAIPARFSSKGLTFDGAGDRPIIESFLEAGFRELIVDPPRTLVVGVASQPWRLRGGEVADVVDLAGFRDFDEPGFVLIATSFELGPVAGGTRLATETRVQPTDARTARAFRPYWLAIRAGSGLIRHDVLRAVSRRAESVAAPPS
jgi:hypothetical protein